MTKRFLGTRFHFTSRRYTAYLRVDDRLIHLGRWNRATDAAIARDRAILFFGKRIPLQVPSKSRKLGPASPEELRRLGILSRKRADRNFVGVHFDRKSGHWIASVRHKGRH